MTTTTRARQLRVSNSPIPWLVFAALALLCIVVLIGIGRDVPDQLWTVESSVLLAGGVAHQQNRSS